MGAAVLTVGLETGRNYYGRRCRVSNGPSFAVPQHSRLHAREALRNFPQDLLTSRGTAAFEGGIASHRRVANGVKNDEKKCIFRQKSRSQQRNSSTKEVGSATGVLGIFHFRNNQIVSLTTAYYFCCDSVPRDRRWKKGELESW